MANSISFKNTAIKIGDTISIEYKIKEGDKERVQLFKGILLMIKGSTDANRQITVRKISKIGVGVERILPLSSPNIVSIKVDRTGTFQKAKLFFTRDMTEAETRNKLYSVKK
jgi:large subunit ribosomal protein L19